jgi:hypothetical protein
MKEKTQAGHQWHRSIILATQEAKIRRISVQSQPRAGGVAQVIGLAFKPQY